MDLKETNYDIKRYQQWTELDYVGSMNTSSDIEHSSYIGAWSNFLMMPELQNDSLR